MYLWYMRASYVSETNDLPGRSAREFDSLFKRLVVLMVGHAAGQQTDGELEEIGRDLLQYKFMEYQTRQIVYGEMPATNIEMFLKTCNEMLAKDAAAVAHDSKMAAITSWNNHLRVQLVSACDTMDIGTMMAALNTYEEFNKKHHGMHLRIDRELIRETQRRILAVSIKAKLDDAVRNNEDEEALQRLKAIIEKRGLAHYIYEEVKAMHKKLDDLEKLRKFKEAFLNMDRRHILEIRAYTCPPPVMHDITVATLLILGESEEDTRDWATCKNMCQVVNTPTAKGLYWRVHHFNMNDLELWRAQRALEIIMQHEYQKIKAVGIAAVTLYDFVQSVANQKIQTATPEELDLAQKQQRRMTARRSRILKATERRVTKKQSRGVSVTSVKQLESRTQVSSSEKNVEEGVGEQPDESSRYKGWKVVKSKVPVIVEREERLKKDVKNKRIEGNGRTRSSAPENAKAEIVDAAEHKTPKGEKQMSPPKVHKGSLKTGASVLQNEHKTSLKQISESDSVHSLESDSKRETESSESTLKPVDEIASLVAFCEKKTSSLAIIDESKASIRADEKSKRHKKHKKTRNKNKGQTQEMV